MIRRRRVWAGVDVGAAAKGFHLALVDERRLVGGPERCRNVAEAAGRLVAWAPRLVAVAKRLFPEDPKIAELR